MHLQRHPPQDAVARRKSNVSDTQPATRAAYGSDKTKVTSTHYQFGNSSLFESTCGKCSSKTSRRLWELCPLSCEAALFNTPILPSILTQSLQVLVRARRVCVRNRIFAGPQAQVEVLGPFFFVFRVCLLKLHINLLSDLCFLNDHASDFSSQLARSFLTSQLGLFHSSSDACRVWLVWKGHACLDPNCSNKIHGRNLISKRNFITSVHCPCTQMCCVGSHHVVAAHSHGIRC